MDKQAPVKLPKAMGYVSYKSDKCAGCLTCMAVCSLYHEGTVCLDLARIQVVAPILKIFEADVLGFIEYYYHRISAPHLKQQVIVKEIE